MQLFLCQQQLLFYIAYFLLPPPITKENLAEKNKTEQNTDAPSLDQKETVTEITREEALNQNKRIQFENQNISWFNFFKRCCDR